MMKIYLSRILVAGGMLLTFSSCREELVTENQVQDQIIAEGTTRNGRLYFPNRESLQITIIKWRKFKKKSLVEAKEVRKVPC